MRKGAGSKLRCTEGDHSAEPRLRPAERESPEPSPGCVAQDRGEGTGDARQEVGMGWRARLQKTCATPGSGLLPPVIQALITTIYR